MLELSLECVYIANSQLHAWDLASAVQRMEPIAFVWDAEQECGMELTLWGAAVWCGHSSEYCISKTYHSGQQCDCLILSPVRLYKTTSSQTVLLGYSLNTYGKI